MKSLFLTGLLSSVFLLSGCGEEENLRNQVAALNMQLTTMNSQSAARDAQINTCKVGAQSQYDAHRSVGSILPFDSHRISDSVEAIAEHKRDGYFWKCMQTSEANP